MTQAGWAALQQRLLMRYNFFKKRLTKYLGSPQPQPQEEDRRKNEERRGQIDGSSYDPYSPAHLLGNGKLTEKQKKKLSADEKNNLEKLVGQSGRF